MFVVFRFVVTADTLWPTLTATPALQLTLASASAPAAYSINNVGSGSAVVLSFAARCSQLGA